MSRGGRSGFYNESIVTEYVEKSKKSQPNLRYLDDKILLSQIDRPYPLWVQSNTNADIVVDSSGASSQPQFIMNAFDGFFTNSIPGSECHLVFDLKNNNSTYGIMVEPYGCLRQLQHDVNGVNIAQLFNHPYRFAANEILDLPLEKNMMDGFKYSVQTQYSQVTPFTSSITTSIAPPSGGASSTCANYIAASGTIRIMLPWSIIFTLMLSDTNSLNPVALLNEQKVTLTFQPTGLWCWMTAASPTAVSVTLQNIKMLCYQTGVSDEYFDIYRRLYETGQLVINCVEKYSLAQGITLNPNTSAQEITIYPTSKLVQSLEYVLESSNLTNLTGSAYKVLTTCLADVLQYWIKVNGVYTSQLPYYVKNGAGIPYIDAFNHYTDIAHTRKKSQWRGDIAPSVTCSPQLFSNYSMGSRHTGYPTAYSGADATQVDVTSCFRMVENMSSVDPLAWSGHPIRQTSLTLWTGSGSSYVKGATNVASDTAGAITGYNLVLLLYCRAQLLLSSPNGGVSTAVLPRFTAV